MSKFTSSWCVVVLGVLAGCASVDEYHLVAGVHVRDLPPAHFRVAVLPVSASASSPGVATSDGESLPLPNDVGKWQGALATRLDRLKISDSSVEAQATGGSHYDLLVEVGLDWNPELRGAYHNTLVAGLAWGFLWPLSVTADMAVKDRTYDAAVTAKVRLLWTLPTTSSARQAQQELSVPMSNLLLSLPDRQSSLWWKIAAFSPLYFWVPDEPDYRNAQLREAVLDRLAAQITRLVKIDQPLRFDDFQWQGDELRIRPKDGYRIEVDVPGPGPTYKVPSARDFVRLTISARIGGVERAWMQTVPRPAGQRNT